jgi:hypothetical protein
VERENRVIRGGQAGRLTAPKRTIPAVSPKRVVAGPFIGMRDSLDPAVSNDPKYARVLQNMMPLALDGPTSFVSRPGFDKLLSSQLGAAETRTGQLVHQFINSAGTELTLLIVGGKAYSYFPLLDLASAPSGTVGDTSARYYAVTFGSVAIYHDGVAQPAAFDGALFPGTTISAAPILYGQPVVYYAKLFGIKSTERNVIVWSEENDETIGYETVPYSNSWELGQTSQEPLYALAATNEALYYFRARSIGKITGAVTPDFATDGTHEGISQSVGTISPDGVCVVGERVFFLDAGGRPHVIERGQAVPLFDDLTETIRLIDKTKLSKAVTRYDPSTGLVRFGVVELGQNYPSMTLLYNPVLSVSVGVERGYTFTAMGVTTPRLTTAAPAGTEQDAPALLHLSEDGYAYIHGTPNGSIWSDYFNAGTVAISHVVETCHLATDSREEKRYPRTDLALRADQDYTAISVRHITPYGSSTAVTGTVTRSGPRYGAITSLYGASCYGSGISETHLPIGVNQVGRWIRHRITHAVAGERFGFTSLSTQVIPAGDAPGAL